MTSDQITTAFRSCGLALALMLSGPALAAGSTCAPTAESGQKNGQDETEEVASNSRETVSSPKDMQAWLRRLVGRYTLDGYVDLCGRGNTKDQRSVTGKVDCIVVSVAPDVHCKFNVSWPAAGKESGASSPGGVSNIAPAQFLFSVEIPLVIRTPDGVVIPPYFYGDGANHAGIVVVQVDNKGVGEYASGVLVHDTFVSTEACIDIPGDCHRITRVAINPESTGISMTVEVRIDHQRVMRQAFMLHRKPDVRKTE